METQTTTLLSAGTMTTSLKRFIPEPEKIKPIRIWTERDFAILEAHARFKFLTTSQITELVGGHPRKVQIRLQKMFHHGYLARPVKQIHLWGTTGTKDYVTHLTHKGVRHLRDEGGRRESAQLLLRTYQAPERSAHLLHTFGISSYFLAMDRDKDEHDVTIDWWPESGTLRSSVQISVKGRKRPYPIFPDAFYRQTVKGYGGLRSFVEIHTGTEPIERGIKTDFANKGSDVTKKLRAYWQWGYIEKKHKKHDFYKQHAPKGFVVQIVVMKQPGFDSKREVDKILNLTKTRDRANRIRINPLPRTDMFWVAEWDPYSKQSIYELDFTTFKGSTKRLV